VAQDSVHWRLVFIRNAPFGPTNFVKAFDLPSDYQLLHAVNSLTTILAELVSIFHIYIYMLRNNVSMYVGNYILHSKEIVNENLEICSNVIFLCKWQF
jgi:hypothetical protein